MASVTVLLSAMGLSDTSILKRLKITGPSIVIDQCDEEGRERVGNSLLIKTRERGLSRSRNMALREAAVSGAEYCIFCDNDVQYEDDYEKTIESAFRRNPDSDILVFFIERPERHEPVLKREGSLDRIHSMKIFSPEIAFRLSSIKRAGLRMDELFGAGAKYGMGEENIFLFDALKKGLKITYIPVKIASTLENESTWFKGYDREFFRNRGAGYYRMSKWMYPLLCLQFALRKRKLYRDQMGFGTALSAMAEGKREYLSEKRYFLVGDCFSGTGPANATLALLAAMPLNTLYLKSRGKLSRAIEIMRKIPLSDAVIFSGHSRQNILGMKQAKKAGVPSVYIMHGAVEHENRINRVPDERMAADERQMMELADLILAVSPTFERWLKDNYLRYDGKIGHLTNGVDWSGFYVNHKRTEKGPISLLSVGGGMPRKRIIKICEAIEQLREKEGLDIRFHIAGDKGADSEEIDSYGFVVDHGLIGTVEMRALYASSRIYIQNSVFETFGLAPVEALLSGCDIIISRECGVRELFRDMEDNDVIDDTGDISEIGRKIAYILENGNNQRLLKSLDRESTGWEKRAAELCRILEDLKR